jgi:peptidoglycan hydrolase-like protein with peptidoglycan-binding domain
MDSAFGSYVPVTSAGRSYQEQADAYYRYRYQGGPLALPPGTSVHETGNACDFGSGAWDWLGAWNGVGWRGGNANDHGWVRTVDSEVWHFEYEGGGVAGGGGEFPARELYGEAWVKAIQDKLMRLGYDLSPDGADGYDGPKTQAAVSDFQSKNGLDADGVAGPITNNALDNALTATPVGGNISSRPTVEIQKFLISKGYDLGSWGADGDYGSATTAAVVKYQSDVGLTPDGIWGPATDIKAFPGVPAEPTTEWPIAGHNATTRPTKDIQQKLIDLGYDLGSYGADGVYGKDSSVAVAKFQKDKSTSVTPNLEVDGIYGPRTDLVLFPGVALPDAPAAPDADPTYGKKIPTYPGATWADVSPNKSTRTGAVQYFYVHHAADPRAKQTQIDRFMVANDRNVSCNWFIGSDGTASEIVPPDYYRAWTTGSPDHNAVTVETQNTSGAPDWGVSDASVRQIAELVAWASNRYKFPIDRQHVIGHREVTDPATGKPYATACPGPSLYPRLAEIVELAKNIYVEKYTNQPPVVVDPPVDPDPEVPADKILVDRAAVVAVRDALNVILGE